VDDSADRHRTPREARFAPASIHSAGICRWTEAGHLARCRCFPRDEVSDDESVGSPVFAWLLAAASAVLPPAKQLHRRDPAGVVCIAQSRRSTRWSSGTGFCLGSSAPRGAAATVHPTRSSRCCMRQSTTLSTHRSDACPLLDPAPQCARAASQQGGRRGRAHAVLVALYPALAPSWMPQFDHH